jgi:cellobiose phosphorylase
MYRLVTESLLGLTREGNRLRIAPCLPADWTAFTVRYRYGDTVYAIAIAQVAVGAGDPAGVRRMTLDAVEQPGDAVLLVDDRGTHHVQIEIVVSAA